MAVVVAIALRIVLRLRFNDLHSPELWEFSEIARNLIESRTYTYRSNGVPSAFMPPAYPLLIALFYKVFGVGWLAHAVLSMTLLLFEIAIPFLTGYLAFLIWGRTAGTISFLLSLFWPQFLLMSGRLSSIQISTALLIGACVFAVDQDRPLRTRAVLSGVTLGAYGLFRFEALAFLVPFGFLLLRVERWGSSGSPAGHIRRAITTLLLFAVAFFATLSPWLVRNYVVFDRVVLSTSGGYNLRRGHHPAATGTAREANSAHGSITETSSGGTPVPGAAEMARVVEQSPEDVLAVDRFFRDEALQFALQNPMMEVRLAAKKFFYFLVADFTHPVSRLVPVWAASFLAFVCGLVSWVKRGSRDPRQQFLWLAFATQACVAVVFFVLPRYRMGVDFVPVVFFAAALGEILERKATKSQQKEEGTAI